MEFSRAILGMGPVELHFITKSPLKFCACPGGFSQPLLNEHFSSDAAGERPAGPDSHQMVLNAGILSTSTPGSTSAAPGARADWTLCPRRPHSAGMNSFFQLPDHLFSIVEKIWRWSWLNVGMRAALNQREVQAPFHQIRNSHLKLAASPNPSVDSVFVYVK